MFLVICRFSFCILNITAKAEWIADFLQHGLLQASYVPVKQQRELRELVRYRKSHVGESNLELNRLQKMLEGDKIKISGTITDINDKSEIMWRQRIPC